MTFRKLAWTAPIGGLLAAGLVVATPASAQTVDLGNPLATADATDLDVASLLVDAAPERIEVDVDTENVAASTPVSFDTVLAPDASVDQGARVTVRVYVDQAGSIATIRGTRFDDQGQSTALPTGTARIVRYGKDTRFAVDRAQLGWDGPVFAATTLTNEGQTVRAAASVDARTGLVTGLGPVAPDVAGPVVTRTRVRLGASEQAYGQPEPVSVTALVTRGATGRVDFFDGATRVATAPVTSGVATTQLPRTLPAGVRTIRAAYVPEDGSAHAPSTDTATLTVRPALATRTTISLSAGRVTAGYRTPVRATVAVPNGLAGTVSLFRGSARLAQAPVQGGRAVLTVPRLAVGRHALRAVFAPTDIRHASSSASATLTVLRAPARATRTTLKVSRTSQVRGSRTRITATAGVTAGARGTVTFYDGRRKLRTVTVQGGRASYRLSSRLKTGRHRLTAVFAPADPHAFRSSRSAVVTVKVRRG